MDQWWSFDRRGLGPTLPIKGKLTHQNLTRHYLSKVSWRSDPKSIEVSEIRRHPTGPGRAGSPLGTRGRFARPSPTSLHFRSEGSLHSNPPIKKGRSSAAESFSPNPGPRLPDHECFGPGRWHPCHPPAHSRPTGRRTHYSRK